MPSRCAAALSLPRLLIVCHHTLAHILEEISMSAALDHRSSRPHTPFITARNDRDAYSQMVLFRPRSPSLERFKNELPLREQARRKGKSSAVSVA